MRVLLVACAVLATCSIFSAVHAEQKHQQKGSGPIIAEVLGRKIRMSQKDAMVGIIFGSLLERYAKEHKIEPTKAEIAAFVAKSSESRKQDHKEWEKERKDILKKLKSKTLSESERKKLASKLETLNSLLKTDPEMDKYEKEHPEKVKKINEKVAKHFIQAWKVNHALFRQYGGRVIFQQAGPEPLDAYRDFLKEHEKKGSFKILDKSLEPSFWNYFVNDSMHVFTSETREQGEKIFKTPWWLADKPDGRD